MKMKLGLMALFLTLPALSQTQLHDINNVPSAAISTAVATLYSFKKADLPPNTISGTCIYREASCNGARIILSHEGKSVFETTITSSSFTIPNLKKNETYQLKLSWNKHQLSETKEVTTGEFITMTLVDKNKK